MPKPDLQTTLEVKSLKDVIADGFRTFWLWHASSKFWSPAGLSADDENAAYCMRCGTHHDVKQFKFTRAAGILDPDRPL